MVERIKKHFYVWMIVLLCGYALPVFADPVHKANVRVGLVSDVSGIVPGETFRAGLRMAIDDGWHIYWRNSGDTGLATRVEWELPDGFKAGDIHWPYPRRINYDGGLTSYGYEGEVILLTEMKAPEDVKEGEEQHINAKVEWLSCKKICVPGKAELSMNLPAHGGPARIREDVRQLFDREQQRWPVTEAPWKVEAFDQGDAFSFKIFSDRPVPYEITEMAFFPYRNDIIDHAGNQLLSQVELRYELIVPKAVLLEGKIRQIQGVLVSGEGWKESGKGHGLSVDVSVDE